MNAMFTTWWNERVHIHGMCKIDLYEITLYMVSTSLRGFFSCFLNTAGSSDDGVSSHPSLQLTYLFVLFSLLGVMSKGPCVDLCHTLRGCFPATTCLIAKRVTVYISVCLHFPLKAWFDRHNLTMARIIRLKTKNKKKTITHRQGVALEKRVCNE